MPCNDRDEPTLSDDLVPKRPKGRPVRRIENGLDPVPGARKDSAKCWECPKWDGRWTWCPIRAALCKGSTTACRYGVVLIRAKRLADRRDNGK